MLIFCFIVDCIEYINNLNGIANQYGYQKLSITNGTGVLTSRDGSITTTLTGTMRARLLTYDEAKGTYICVRNADVNSYKCNCQTCQDPYRCVVSQDCGSYSTQTYTYTDSCPQSGTCISQHTVCVNKSCTVSNVVTNYETCTKWYSCTKTGTKTDVRKWQNPRRQREYQGKRPD